MRPYIRWVLISRGLVFLGGGMILGPPLLGYGTIPDDKAICYFMLAGLLPLAVGILYSLGWIFRGSTLRAWKEEDRLRRTGARDQ